MEDYTEFDRNVMDIFDICKSILKVADKRNLSFSDRKNPYLNRLEKYIKTYSKTDPSEHVVYFERIYTNNKRFILLGPQRDAWLIDGNLIISYGEDCGLKTDMKLHLSGIYSTAVKFRDEIREEIQGLPNTPESIETTYPANFMLTLYRIFKEISKSDVEKTKLTSHIDTMEEEAGIQSKNNSSDPLAGLLDMASNMAEQVSGNKIPKDKLPGKNDFGKMISSVIDNPKTKSMLGNMMQKFQETNNIGDIVTQLVGSLSAQNTSEGQSAVDGPQGIETDTTKSTTPVETKSIEGASVNDEFDDYN